MRRHCALASVESWSCVDRCLMRLPLQESAVARRNTLSTRSGTQMTCVSSRAFACVAVAWQGHGGAARVLASCAAAARLWRNILPTPRPCPPHPTPRHTKAFPTTHQNVSTVLCVRSAQRKSSTRAATKSSPRLTCDQRCGLARLVQTEVLPRPTPRRQPRCWKPGQVIS